HSSGSGLLRNGRHSQRTRLLNLTRSARPHQRAEVSSERTRAVLGRTGKPANSPPANFDKSTERSVVLPDFDRLVSSVTFPGARYPSQSHAVCSLSAARISFIDKADGSPSESPSVDSFC